MEGDEGLARVSILIQAIDRVAGSTGGQVGARSGDQLRMLAELRARAVAELTELEANEARRRGRQ
jgi:hypothetical protein